jgi:hypothetical protein
MRKPLGFCVYDDQLVLPTTHLAMIEKAALIGAQECFTNDPVSDKLT